MKQSEQRILTTHVGSLPRARELSDLLIADEARQPIDHARLEALAAEGVKSVVARQVAAGLDVINDGEQLFQRAIDLARSRVGHLRCNNFGCVPCNARVH